MFWAKTRPVFVDMTDLGEITPVMTLYSESRRDEAFGPGGTIWSRGVGRVVVVVAGVVDVVVDVVVVESELPLLDSAKLTVNAMSAKTTKTAPSFTTPTRHRLFPRVAA